MMQRFLSACFVALFLTMPARAAVCAHFSAGSVNVNYDPLGSQSIAPVIQPISLSVAPGVVAGTASIASVTAQFLDLDSVNSYRVGTAGPIYSIVGSNPVVVGQGSPELLPNQSFMHVFSNTTSGVQEPVRGLKFEIDPGQDIPAGIYNETLDVVLKCSTAQNLDQAIQEQSGVLHVSVDVPSKLIASLEGGAATRTLDFDQFQSRQKSAMVDVYSTGPFTVAVSSENGGHMQLLGTIAPRANERISYDVTINGMPVSFGAATRFGRTGIGGAAMPLTVTTETVEHKRAGTYQDTLTILLEPATVL